MFDQPVSPTPYEQMQAQREAKRGVGRPALSDYQREARKHANSLASRRAYYVLKERHRAEYNALAKAERHALYAKIDAAYARGETPDVNTL